MNPTREIEETADRIAFALGARHVGEGHIECGDTSADNPSAEVAYGDVVTNVYLDEDDGVIRVAVSIVWRDGEGDIVDVGEVADRLSPDDTDSIAAAIVAAGAP